jgi:hypothetical protein
MSRLLTILSLLILFCVVSEDAFAQRRTKYSRRKNKNKAIDHYKGGFRGQFRNYQYFGVGINALNYYGDLAPVNRAGSSDISFTRPGLGLMWGYRFHPASSFRVNFNYGRLKGDDFTSDPNDPESAARYVRNLSFRNDIKEFNAGFNFYFFPDNRGPSYRTPINIYLFVGAGFFLHEPKGKVPDIDYQGNGEAPPSAGEWINLRPLGTEGQNLDIEGVGEVYSPFQFNIPIALGAMLRLPGPFNAHIEFGYRFVFTDYLDDVSTNYVNLELFDDPLARIMSDRSSEEVAVWNGETRLIESVPVNFGSSTYNIGGGTTEALQGPLRGANDLAIRGNPNSNDMYFVTQIKLTYIVQQGSKRRRTAKFR